MVPLPCVAGWPSKGFEIQVNNSYVKDRVKTGSLYHVQDVLDNSPAKDDAWFTERLGDQAPPPATYRDTASS